VISFSLQNVLGTFTLDLALLAAETEGLVRVISAPARDDQDNTAAEIQSGFQIVPDASQFRRPPFSMSMPRCAFR